MKYFIHLSYEGTDFSGWQTQAVVNSIQSTLRETISTLLRQDTSIMGCGRTDAGVHASQYFAHFRTDKSLIEGFIFKCNRMLPRSIRLHNLIEVKDGAHVQRNAIYRQYDYYIHTKKNPFINHISSYYALEEFDPILLKKALKLLTGKLNFEQYCTNPHDYDSCVCEIYKAELLKINDNQWVIQIAANRFLKSMVRLIVGRLIDLAKGRMNFEEFENSIKNQIPTTHKKPAFPQGLFLSKVKYPYLDIPTANSARLRL